MSTLPSNPQRGITALSLPQVCDKTSLGRTSIFDLAARGSFPKPAKVGRRCFWDEAEVDAWLQARFDQRASA